jgi:hypothetical protein
MEPKRKSKSGETIPSNTDPVEIPKESVRTPAHLDEKYQLERFLRQPREIGGCFL